MGDLAERIGYSQSSTSRNVAGLSEWHRARRPGAGLLEAKEDPENRRQKRVYLFKKGQVFAKHIRELLNHV